MNFTIHLCDSVTWHVFVLANSDNILRRVQLKKLNNPLNQDDTHRTHRLLRGVLNVDCVGSKNLENIAYESTESFTFFTDESKKASKHCFLNKEWDGNDNIKNRTENTQINGLILQETQFSISSPQNKNTKIRKFQSNKRTTYVYWLEMTWKGRTGGYGYSGEGWKTKGNDDFISLHNGDNVRH